MKVCISKLSTQICFVGFFIFLDQITKWFSKSYWSDEAVHFFGLVFTNVANSGFAFSSFTHLPESYRLAFTAGLGFFFLALYFLINLMIRKPAPLTRWALTCFIAGALGNVFDRINWGFATDWLSFAPSLDLPIFNLADIFQFIGFGLFFYSLYAYRADFFFSDEKRSQFFVSKTFQYRLLTFFALSTVGFSLVLSVFSYTFLKVTLKNTVIPFESQASILNTSIVFFVIYTALFLILICVLASIYSHRIAGPFHKFKNFIENKDYKKNLEFKLRSSDEFKELEDLAQKIKDEFQNK